MAGFDSFLELERALQRLTHLDFDRLDDSPGPVYDLADDMETVLSRDDAAALASFLNHRIDEWEEGR